MKWRLLWAHVIVALSLALLASGSPASAGGTPLSGGTPTASTAPFAASQTPGVFAAGAGRGTAAYMSIMPMALPPCDEIEASPVAWVTIDEEGHITGQVESYPADTFYLAAAFQVSCMPAHTTLKVVWSRGSTTIFSRKFVPKPLLTRGQIMEFVGMPDESPLGKGKYGVKFYRDKELLTSGEVMVGEGAPPADKVTVTGDVQDKRTRKPIAGVTIYVAKEGVKIDEFLNNDMPAEDTFIKTTTNSQGKFVFDKPLARKTKYAWVFAAKGYMSVADQVAIDDLGEPPYHFVLRKVGQ
jgi:hypothetical protein